MFFSGFIIFLFSEGLFKNNVRYYAAQPTSSVAWVI
jgi:hypothetical protein